MSQIRITGFASGFDTDKIIRDMMRAENTRTDKLHREKTSIVWQQEAFRGVIDKIQSFQKNYFDVLKPTSNFRSATAFSMFEYQVTSGGKPSEAVSISTRADSGRKEMRIDRIDQLATKDRWVGNASKLRGLRSQEIDLDKLKAGGDLELSLAIGGSVKKIALGSAELAGVTSTEELAQTLQSRVSSEFGADYAGVVTADSDRLRFDFPGSEVKVLRSQPDDASLDRLGLRNGASSYDYRSKSLEDLLGLTQQQLDGFAVNGVEIKLRAEMSIGQMVDAINRSSAGVNIRYNSLNDRFEMESKLEGSANNIAVRDGSAAERVLGMLMGASDLVSADGSIQQISRSAGQNAQLTIDGVSIVKGENTFAHEGSTITLHRTSTEAVELKTQVNTQQVVDKIKDFVKEYNEIIDHITTKVNEKRNAEFRPLTDAEKEEMTEKQIEKWEEKAKAGILRGSGELNEMINRLRTAMIESTEGVGLTLRDIGIASASYTDRGKLTVNEEKLKVAIENRFDEVVSLFTKSSEISYSDTADRVRRTKENGIAHRIDDIMRDYARTTRDSKGSKGILVEKAGVQNDASYLKNRLSEQIRGYDSRINDLVKKLARNEARYYQMFSQMETALSRMQAQSNSLFGMFGQGGGK